MADIRKLDPDTRCLALVGMYLQRWAIMENTLREVMAQILGTGAIYTAIIASNMQLRDKIHTLRTLINMSGILNEAGKKEYDTLLKQIATASSNRNMLAHDLFYPSDDGNGVAFFITKAKGKFDVPATVWSIDQFEAEFLGIERFTESLERLAMLYEQHLASGMRPPT